MGEITKTMSAGLSSSGVTRNKISISNHILAEQSRACEDLAYACLELLSKTSQGKRLMKYFDDNNESVNVERKLEILLEHILDKKRG